MEETLESSVGDIKHGRDIVGSAKRMKIMETPRKRMWLELDCDVYKRWCAFARDLCLTPRQLAPVLLDVAMGISPLPQHSHGAGGSAMPMAMPMELER